MDFRPLLQKLIEIEMSVGVEPAIMTRNRVYDAEDCLLQMQSEMVSSHKHDAAKAESERPLVLREHDAGPSMK